MMTIKYNRSSTDLINKAEALIYDEQKQMVFSKNYETSDLRNKETTFDRYKINFFEGKNRIMLEYFFFKNLDIDKKFEHATLRINRQTLVKIKNKNSKFSKILHSFFTSFDLLLKLSSHNEGYDEQDIKNIKNLSSKVNTILEKLEKNVSKDLYYLGYDEKDLKLVSAMTKKLGNLAREIQNQVLSETAVENE